MPLNIEVVGKTDKGLVRSSNEDCLHIDENHHVYAVCDGMGGHQAGEVASITASETILKAFTHFRQALIDDSQLAFERTLPPNGESLIKSIRLASRAIYNMALQDPGLAGMGTTIVALVLEADVMSIAHVGDSRAYCLREKALQPLTKDHSWVAEIQETQNLSAEEASSVVGKNVITRALGVRENVEVDCRIAKVSPGDIFILCSDGLCGFADDDEIFEVARRAKKDLKRITDDLVQMANDRGGSDNVSVIAVEVVENDESPLPPLDVFTVPAESPELLAVEDEWLKKFAEHDVGNNGNNTGSSSHRGGTPALLLFIFAIFAVIAVLIIWLQAN